MRAPSQIDLQFAGVYPDKGMGSVIMFNRTGMSDDRFLDKVTQRGLVSFEQSDRD